MKMNHHYGELKASYLFVDIAHKVAAYQEAHPEKEIIRMGIGDVTQPLAQVLWWRPCISAADEMGSQRGLPRLWPGAGLCRSCKQADRRATTARRAATRIGDG